MSIYPTLCDLAGLPTPAHVEGVSIRPLLEDPKAKWDRPAVTTFHKDNHSIRSETWRYIRYADGSEELYNHDQDPYEWTNLAKDPQYDSVKADLARYAPQVNAAERPRTLGEGEKEKAGVAAKSKAGKKAKRKAAQ
jgi:arylsulfatase A-like enzyme